MLKVHQLHKKSVKVQKALKRGNMAKRMHRRAWLNRKRLKKLRHKSRRSNVHVRKLHQLFVDLNINHYTHDNVSYDIAKRRLYVKLPENLNFRDNFEETASHYTVLRKAIENNVRIAGVDFSGIKTMTTAAALVLASIVDQWRERVGGKLTADLPTWSQDITKLLSQMGYFELLNLQAPQIDNSQSCKNYIKFLKGKVGESNSGAKAKALRESIEEIAGQEINSPPLYQGLTEAITNVCHHAYIGIADERRKYWWLTGSFDSNTRELQVTFYDKGIGIPKTLPAHDLFETIKELFGQWKDSRKICAAMELGRTSTGLEERGKGLQDLIEFAKAYNMGKLRVCSLKGSYEETYQKDNADNPVNTEMIDHKFSIGGTLLQWTVTL